MSNAFGVGIPYALFFLSGVAALAYEISWSRQIGLLFGHTATAAATVLASYFAGLAGGYWIGGRFATNVRRPLVAYGLCEMAAALSALAIPPLLWMLELPLLAPLIHHPNPTWQTIIRAAVCLLLLLPATTALGVTLPLMACWLEARDNQNGASRIAWAYGLNTLGGLVGALGTTWFMLSFVGVTTSSYVAAALSAFCGLVAIVLGFSTRSDFGTTADNESTLQDVKAKKPTPRFALLATLVAACGFATLALEVLYTRMFALVFHNSTYTFGLVIAVVLLGLAAGAWVAAYAGSRFKPLMVAGWASLCAGGAVAVSILMFLRQTHVDYFLGGETFASYMLASLGLVALVVLPPALLLGTVLPLLWGVANATLTRSASEESSVFAHDSSFARRASVPNFVGRLTAINTLAAAAGTLAASFVLLPLLGLWTSFAAMAVVCIVAGMLLLSACAKPTPVQLAALIALSLLIFAAWRITISETSVPPGKTLVQRSESSYGWIDVLRDDASGELSLRENVNYTHGSTASADWERRQGHIPLLLHRQPRDVLFLGAGTGATAGAATLHDDVESIVVVELIPQVIEAARLFEKSNLGVFADPRTEVHNDDARHYLLATDRLFDVIVSDLFVPWESKTGYLYTVDHYRVARSRLAPGGLVCQWLPMWQLGEREYVMIADSFAEVFPHTTVWLGKGSFNRTIIGLVGSEEPLQLNGTELQARLAALAAKAKTDDLALNEPKDLSRRFIGEWPGEQYDDLSRPSTTVDANTSTALEGRRTGRPPLNTDEHPRLEFATPFTYADHRTLKGERMQDYHGKYLTRLRHSGVDFTDWADAETTAAARHDWQRIRMRK